MKHIIDYSKLTAEQKEVYFLLGCQNQRMVAWRLIAIAELIFIASTMMIFTREIPVYTWLDKGVDAIAAGFFFVGCWKLFTVWMVKDNPRPW